MEKKQRSRVLDMTTGKPFNMVLRFALPYCSCFEVIYYEESIQKYSEGCPQTDLVQNGGRRCFPALFYYHMDIHGSISDWADVAAFCHLNTCERWGDDI